MIFIIIMYVYTCITLAALLIKYLHYNYCNGICGLVLINITHLLKAGGYLADGTLQVCFTNLMNGKDGYITYILKFCFV